MINNKQRAAFSMHLCQPRSVVDIAYRHITRTRLPGIVGMDCAGSTGVIGNARSDHGLDYLHADKSQWVETPSGTGGTAVPHC